ncbi:MAG: hypothetical protein OXH29_00510 [bacterium]|nr:hypothetical protein [bacterium]
MDELIKLRTSVAEARHRAAEANRALRDDPQNAEVAERASDAAARLTLAQAELAQAESEQRDIEAAKASSQLASAAGLPTPTADAPSGDDVARAVAAATLALSRGAAVPSEAGDVFAAFGVAEPIGADNTVHVPPAMAEALAGDQRSTVGAITSQVRYSRSRVYSIMRDADPRGTLGISEQPAEVGEFEAVHNTSGPTGQARAESAAIAVTGVAGVEQRLEPVRIGSGSYHTLEAAATLSDVADIVQGEVVASLDDAVVSQVFNGDGAAPNLQGLNGRAEALRSRPAAVDTFATVVTALEGLVDGRYAMDTGDLSIVATPAAHAFLASLRVSDDSMESALAYVRRMVRAYSVTSYAPADYTESSTEAGRGFNLLVRRGMHDGAYLLPVWGMRIATDEYTRMAEGERRIYAWKLMQAFWPQAAAAEGLRADFGTIELRSVADDT